MHLYHSWNLVRTDVLQNNITSLLVWFDERNIYSSFHCTRKHWRIEHSHLTTIATSLTPYFYLMKRICLTSVACITVSININNMCWTSQLDSWFAIRDWWENKRILTRYSWRSLLLFWNTIEPLQKFLTSWGSLPTSQLKEKGRGERKRWHSFFLVFFSLLFSFSSLSFGSFPLVPWLLTFTSDNSM